MAASHLLRLGSVKDVYNKQDKLIQNGLLALLKHHKRTELPKENIDRKRSNLNYCLSATATPASIAAHANGQMLNAGIETRRKNGVMAVEVLFSVPIDRHSQDTRPFFNDCFTWLQNNFAGELLSFDIHLDESAPHAHALILPLINGKMQGNKLIGGTGNLMRLINLFHQDVAKHYGLSRANYKRLTANDKQSIEHQVLTRLKGDSVMLSSVWACVRDDIHKNPMTYAQLLSIELAKPTRKTNKSFVQIMTGKGKGKAYEATNTI